ncbi:MAG TPA: cytochrome c oxidase assembly protein [Gaiellaceae bacterium]|nr:cytochrome c oxidase assembly protein [Gaiellaceae bacterium]
MLHVRSGYPGRAALVLGIVFVLGADVAPLGGGFSTHMIQHLLLGDLGPLLIVLGLTGSTRFAHPFAALPLWSAALVAWHLTPLYDAALDHVWLHQLEHVCFAAAGLVLWASILLDGPAWFTAARKLPYVLAMWLVSLALSQVFIWSDHSYYSRYSLSDQRTGGGVMLIEGSFVMLGVIVWLLMRVLAESEARQRALEGR